MNCPLIKFPVNTDIEKSIIELEKELLRIAPDHIKKLYLQIDFLRCQQESD